MLILPRLGLRCLHYHDHVESRGVAASVFELVKLRLHALACDLLVAAVCAPTCHDCIVQGSGFRVQGSGCVEGHTLFLLIDCLCCYVFV